MSGFIEIIVSLLVLGVLGAYLSKIIGLISIVLPTGIIAVMTFIISLVLILFVIHRRN